MDEEGRNWRDRLEAVDGGKRRKDLGGRTGTILRPSSVPLSSKNQEINRLQLAVKLPWAILYESCSGTPCFFLLYVQSQ
ncbi:hypothetical protein TNCV_2527681 [Trichonephila clavipes]|nr:hypothetical protein TNCV_2527681 [Trichonephila clavipes]